MFYKNVIPELCLYSKPCSQAGHSGNLRKDLFNLGNKAVRTVIEQTEGLYFITFTCQNWLPLFEITNCCNVVYKWFGYLDQNKHNIKGYVIMPNHLHVIIEFSKADKKINAIVSNGKRSGEIIIRFGFCIWLPANVA
jgi:hypothetical protein